MFLIIIAVSEKKESRFFFSIFLTQRFPSLLKIIVMDLLSGSLQLKMVIAKHFSLIDSGISTNETNSDGLNLYMLSCLTLEGDQKKFENYFFKGANLEYSLPKDYDFKVKLYKVNQYTATILRKKSLLIIQQETNYTKAGTKAKEFCKD